MNSARVVLESDGAVSGALGVLLAHAQPKNTRSVLATLVLLHPSLRVQSSGLQTA